MRHINLRKHLRQIFATDDGRITKQRLDRARAKLPKIPAADCNRHTRDNGPNKWTPVKNHLIAALGNKCWYTEHELIGAPLVVDHYRPICYYTWLAYDSENYRIACPWSNSPEHNPLYDCAGGKGDNFPLLPPSVRVTRKKDLKREYPVILDPCIKGDCDLLAFQSDGRPILNPQYQDDPVARFRVEESLLLLNLDHPDFNSKREQLCNDIADDVREYEELPVDSGGRAIICTRIERRIAPSAPFSTAALFYLKSHRYLDWVEDIVNPQ